MIRSGWSSRAKHPAARPKPRRVLTGFVFLCLGLACPAYAEATNAPSDAESEGGALAQKILAQRPAESFTNLGTLVIKGDKQPRRELPVVFETVVTETNWRTEYRAQLGANHDETTALVVTHDGATPNLYRLDESGRPAPADAAAWPAATDAAGGRALVPFAGSDFWLCDLGLEFFHWPRQKVVKKEFHRNCACTVLESTNPDPAAGGYSRVVCWIDNDSFGIVEAYAYDLKGRELKNFYPKNLEKVNGRYRVESMVMENLQTGSRSRLDFDLNK